MSDMLFEERIRAFTVGEYHRIAEVGIIADDERVELLDGRIVHMPPIGLRHWTRHATIVAYLNDTLREHAFIVGQGSFPLGLRNEPQPDIAVLSPRDYARDARGPDPHEIFVVVELADSSLSVDLGPKLRIYARHGIADYLVVDLEGDRLLHHSRPHQLGYDALVTLAYDDGFSLTALPGIALSAGPFLRT
jgi:Uma2 family endonuclease